MKTTSMLTALICTMIIMSSCTNQNKDEYLIGTWQSTTMEMQLLFYTDTMIYTFGKPIKFSWSTNESNLYLEQLTNVDNEKQTKFSYPYRFNRKKDTLFLKLSVDATEQVFLKK